MTYIDFFLWGYLKHKVYATQRQKIMEHGRLISGKVLQIVPKEVCIPICYYQEVRGEYFVTVKW